MSKTIDPMVKSLIDGLTNIDKTESQHDSIDEVSIDTEPEDNLESNILKCLFESDAIGSTNIPIKEGKKFNPSTGRIE